MIAFSARIHLITDREEDMKRGALKKRRPISLRIPTLRLNPKEMEALEGSVKILNEEAERLGLLDPMEIEPATIYSAEEGKR